jgi:hypothetical protein
LAVLDTCSPKERSAPATVRSRSCAATPAVWSVVECAQQRSSTGLTVPGLAKLLRDSLGLRSYDGRWSRTGLPGEVPGIALHHFHTPVYHEGVKFGMAGGAGSPVRRVAASTYERRQLHRRTCSTARNGGRLLDPL